MRKTELNIDQPHVSFFNIMPYFIYTDIISSLLDSRLVDPGSALIHFVYITLCAWTITSK